MSNKTKIGGNVTGSTIITGNNNTTGTAHGGNTKHQSVRRDSDSADVVLITAIREEYESVLEVSTGAWPGHSWEKKRGPTGLEVAFCSFVGPENSQMKVVVTQALRMGSVAAVGAASPLIDAYKPRCLAMCGVCAGRKGVANLGDVIIADRLWMYDVGKISIETDSAGQKVERIQGDFMTYHLPPLWKQKAEALRFSNSNTNWLAARPRTYESQMDWVLAQSLEGSDALNHPERRERCANWEKVLSLLWKIGWLHDGTLELTDSGRQHIKRTLLLNGGQLPEPHPFRVHVAPIATGSKVVKDPGLFEKLSNTVRDVAGLEMEAASIGDVAQLRGLEYMIVAKGVMDFSDSDKNDEFKRFAARASAECVLSFLRENLPPGGHMGESI